MKLQVDSATSVKKDNLVQNLERFVYETSAELWPHIPDLRFPWVPAAHVIQDNPFSSTASRKSRSSSLGREVPRLYEAVSFLLWQHGVAFNAHLTIVWRGLSIHDHARAAAILARYNHEAAKWLRVGDIMAPRRRMTKRAMDGGSPHYFVYVHEHGRDEGLHTHMLCVVPREKAKAFEEWSMGCLARLSGRRRPQPDAIWFSPQTKSRGFESYQSNQAGKVARSWDWFRYITKSLRPTAGYRDNDGGVVSARDIFKPYAYCETHPVYLAKLAGGSENVGEGAQRAAGFVSKFATGEWDRLYDGSELQERRRRQKEEAEQQEALKVTRDLII
jgi:hypothetical protein